MRKKTSVDTYTVGDQYATLTYGYNDKGYITSRGDQNTSQYESYTYRLGDINMKGSSVSRIKNLQSTFNGF